MSKEEQIRTAIGSLDDQTAKDALAVLLAEGTDGAGGQRGRSDPGGDFRNFAQAVLWLRSRYGFPELELFSTEADLVYVHAGDRKILLTDPSVPERETIGREQIGAEASGGEDFENAFEPMQKNGRFSNLEL